MIDMKNVAAVFRKDTNMSKLGEKGMSGTIQYLLVLLFGLVVSSTVHAQDLNLAPDCSQATAEPDRLWPPNKKLVPIQIKGVTDPEGQDITLVTQCIRQDEAVGFWLWWFGRYDGAGLNTDTPSVRAKRWKWYPKQNEKGNWFFSKGRVYQIVFKATDSAGAGCTGKVRVDVPVHKKSTVIPNTKRFRSLPGGVNCDAQPVNNPPIIYSTPVTEGIAGSEYQYDVIGHDPDKDELTYSLINPPEGMAIDAQTGLITWVPDDEQVGVHSIEVKVTDPGGLSNSQTYELTIQESVDELKVSIIANPTSGTSPLTVRFSPEVQNSNNIVISSYQWDFDGDGTVDITDTFGAPKTYTYTGTPGTTFEATLTVTPASGDPLVATRTITIDNQPPTAQVSSSVTNGHVPLQVDFTVTAQDPQGIAEVSIDYEGDGVFDATQPGNNATSGSWSFQFNYQNEGIYQARVKVTDAYGATKQVSNNAITVDVNNPQDPVIQLSATPVSGNAPLTVTFTASATIYDGSQISQWSWDLDGDGNYEATGGSNETETTSATYKGVGFYYPSVKVTTDSGRSAIASLRVESKSTALPTLSIPDSSDTINSDASETATFHVTLPYETELEVWIENVNGIRVKTIQTGQLTGSGSHEFTWDGTNDQNDVVSEGDYYVVVGYSTYGAEHEIDLRASTGGQLSYYRRTTANPRTFDRLEAPLRIDFEVDDPAEVSFFWQISFGARLMTLLEHERMGRGRYSLYWNADYPSGQKIPDNINALMPGIVRYSLPDNVIYVKENPRIENYVLKSTIIADPRREPIAFDITLSKPSTIELVVSDMEKGVDVAARVYSGLSAGAQTLTWDGKNNEDQYLAPGDYRIGVRSVDNDGKRSLFWYRTQRIEY